MNVDSRRWLLVQTRQRTLCARRPAERRLSTAGPADDRAPDDRAPDETPDAAQDCVQHDGTQAQAAATDSLPATGDMHVSLPGR